MIAEVGFRLAGGAQPLILVPVKVDDEGTHDFILDTGAGTCLLTPELARARGVEATGVREGQTAGGRVRVPVGNVGSLAVGAARAEKVEVGVVDLSDLGRAVGARVEGNLGYNFLKDFRVTVDYRAGKLRLARGLFETVGRAASQEVGFRLAGPGKPLVLLKAVVNGRDGYDFALDTGCSTTIISPEFARRLKVEGVPIPPISTGGGHRVSAALGSLASLAAGQARVQNLPVVIADSFGALRHVTGASFDGIIGYNFLKDFALTIDYPNERIHFS